MLYQVLPGACLGPQARFRRPAPSTLALGPGEATKKREVAGPSPLLARSPPSEQEEPDRSLPTFQAGPAEQMPLLPVAFSLQWQARPVGSLPRGVPGPSKKPGAGEGTAGTRPPRPTRAAPARGGRRGDPASRAQRKIALNTASNDLGNSGAF